MDYYCTRAALPTLEAMTPEDINDYLEEYSAPTGCIIVTDSFDNTYLTSADDFQAESRLIKYDDNYISIEYFENGIPDWLFPKKGIAIYAADWTGERWEFSKVSGI